MSTKDHNFGSLVCIYSQLLPRIREAGKAMGYAIAVHGSMQRDFDLLAVPWVEDAKPAQELVEFIAKEVSGFVIGGAHDRGEIKDPTIQPHGRLSWNICWGGNAFIDLSVIPPSDARHAVERAEVETLQEALCDVLAALKIWATGKAGERADIWTITKAAIAKGDSAIAADAGREG